MLLMDQGDVPNPQPAEVKSPFVWPDQMTPFTTPFDDRSLRVETYTEAQDRIQKAKEIPLMPDDCMHKSAAELVFFAYDEPRNQDRRFQPKAAWIGRADEDGSYRGHFKYPPQLKSPEGKTLRIEYVYDEDGRVKAIAKEWTEKYPSYSHWDDIPNAYSGETQKLIPAYLNGWD